MRAILIDNRALVLDGRCNDLERHAERWLVEVFEGMPGGDSVTRKLAVYVELASYSELLRAPELMLGGQRYRVAAIVPPHALYIERVD